MLIAIKTLHSGQCSKSDAESIFNFATILDKKDLIDYFSTNTIISYKNDLELYIEILDSLIKIYENDEKYEKCSDLMAQKEKSLSIMNKKTKDYVKS